MKQEKKNDVAVLLDYTGSRRGLTFLGLVLLALSVLFSMAPYIRIWLTARSLIAATPEWMQAQNISKYDWIAFAFTVGGIILHFAGSMYIHLAVSRTASNIRKRGVTHIMKAPLGFFDSNASSLTRGRLDAVAVDIETLLTHNLIDIVGTIVLFLSMLVLLSLSDWRIGAACFLSAVISVIVMLSMMGGKNAKLMAGHQAAQDRMTKAGTEYVRGTPVAKIFQRTVCSLKVFQEAIENYSNKAEHYQADVCRVPQSVNLTFTGGVFMFLVPVALFLAPSALANGSFAGLASDFVFYAVFSAVISTALAKVMFVSSGIMLANTVLGRINQVMEALTLKAPSHPQTPRSNEVESKDVSFTCNGAENPALSHVPFIAQPGQTVALVGPLGGGKTATASLIPRFQDATSGVVEVGEVDVAQIDPHVPVGQMAFVFQNNRLFKASILGNVRVSHPKATREQVMAALTAAQCKDVLNKLSDGPDTQIGTEGTYLSGGKQQRITLVRVTLKDVPIAVLDEATTFVDPENEVLIQKVFATLAKGRTVIMIAHRLSTVVGADKTIISEEGRIVEQGTHAELTASGSLYAQMWTDYNKTAQWRITSEKEAEQMPGEKFQRKYALTDQGVRSTKRGTFWMMIVNLVVMGGVNTLYLVMSGFMGILVEGGLLPGSVLVIGVSILLILPSSMTHLQQYKATYGLAYNEIKTTRLSLAERLRKLPLGYFGKRDLADLTGTIMGDVNRMEHVWSHVLGYLYGACIPTAIIAVCPFVYDWRLAIACLWDVPVAFGPLSGSRKIAACNAERMKKATVRVSDDIQKALENVREIHTTNQGERYLNRLDQKTDEHERVTIQGELGTGLFVNAASAIMRLGVVTTILVGANLILSGSIDFMLLFLFLLVITRVYAPFDQSLAPIVETFVSQVPVDRMNETYGTSTTKGAEKFEPKGYGIAFEHVGFSYDGKEVLHDMSFTAKEDEVTALVGSSGSDKSTRVRPAARLWDIPKGVIRAGGVDIFTVDLEVLLRDYSIVFQDVVLFDGTAMENIRLGKRSAADEEVWAVAKAVNCDELVHRLSQGYNTPIGESGAKLSGGERQRISTARALLKDTPIILLDEATISLDVENETKAQGTFSLLLVGRTVLVITHRMRIVEAADKIIVLVDSKVAEEGTLAELVNKNGLYHRMVDL